MAGKRRIKFTVVAARWFDRINGNTYHSVRCTRHSDGAVVVGPFQYGYGDHYQQTARYAMFDAGWFKNYKRKVLAPADNPDKFTVAKYTQNTISQFEREKNYPILWAVSDGLKRDCVANGKLCPARP